MLGFKNLDCACAILIGIKVTHMIKKGQTKGFGKNSTVRCAAVLLAHFISNTLHIAAAFTFGLAATKPLHSSPQPVRSNQMARPPYCGKLRVVSFLVHPMAIIVLTAHIFIWKYNEINEWAWT